MDNTLLKQKVLDIESTAEITEEKQFLTVNVQPNKLHALAKALKESKDTHFDFLFCLSGVDYGDAMGIVYHLESTDLKHEIVLKTKTTDRENPAFDTVCDIWNTAEFHEREVFDFFGIKFNNHPDLRRLFLEQNWKGFPLRKDYVDEINIIER